MPSTQGVMGRQDAFIPGVKPNVPSVRQQADLLLRFNPGLIDKSLTIQFWELYGEFTDLFDFIDPTRHAEFMHRAIHVWPPIKTALNRLQDAAREIRAREDAERERAGGW